MGKIRRKFKLIDIIICPNCGSYLVNKINKKISSLFCKKCEIYYPIIKNIPRFIIEKKASVDLQKTIVNFGFEWEKWNKLPAFAENCFLDIVKIKPNFFKNKKILDAGCGNGRFLRETSLLIGKLGMAVGVDVSNAIEISYKKLTKEKNVFLFQADIYNLPFKEKFFDIIYCIGVLQHLSDPKKAISIFSEKLSPNGVFIGTFYTKPEYFSIKVYVCLITFLRKILKKVSLGKILFFSRCLSFFTYLIYLKPLSSIPIFSCYFKELYSRYPAYRGEKPTIDYLTHIWFDQLTAPITGFYSQDEISSWFCESGLKPVFPTWKGLVYATKTQLKYKGFFV